MNALEWLKTRQQLGSNYGIARVLYVLDKLDNPQTKIKTIHVTGTNGKGSTISFLRSILRQYQLKVGTFMSPYMTTMTEMISINGNSIFEEHLETILQTIRPFVEEMDQMDGSLQYMTEFEILTVAMFVYFEQQQVDVALVEVGLGGLTDATNVIQPIASLITSIGLDHIDILGSTYEAIATQKSGIIKPNSKVFVGDLPQEALRIIQQTCMDKQVPLFMYGKDFAASLEEATPSGNSFTFANEFMTISGLFESLAGLHQIKNAALALETIFGLQYELDIEWDEQKIRSGLQQTFIIGRLEKIHDKPLVLIDGAHNPAGIRTLTTYIKKALAGKKVSILFSAIQTKNYEAMLEQLQAVEEVKQVTFTTFHDKRALTLTQLEALQAPNIE